MTATNFHEGKTDDGREVTVKWSFDPGEPHGDCPGCVADGGGSGWQVIVERAFDDRGDVELSDAEVERLEAEIAADLDPSDFDPQPDDYL